MSKSDLTIAVTSCVYFVRKLASKNLSMPLVDIVKLVPYEAMTSESLKFKQILSLFDEFTPESIADIVKSNVTNNRYNIQKIVDDLLSAGVRKT